MKARKIQIGSLVTYNHTIGNPEWFRPDMQRIDVGDLSKIGWMQITECGEENIYFTTTAHPVGRPLDTFEISCVCKVA